MRRAVLVLALVATSMPIAAADHVVVKPPDASLLSFIGVHEGTGNDVADAGDVNGDGRNDLLVGTSDNAGPENVGRAYVIWGGNGGRIPAPQLGSRGLEIRSHQPGDLLGQTVSSLGDLDGDGRDEFAVAAPWADPLGRTNAGSVYVVFGGGTPETIVTDDLGSRAIRIDGATSYEFAGGALAAAGDVDGDDVPDLLVGAPGIGHDHVREGGGGAYLISGAALTQDIDLATLGPRGFVMSSDIDVAQAGWSVASAGDMNLDGLDEIVVGAPAEFHETTPGRAFVVFGKTDRDPVALEALGEGGWTISSTVLNDATGRAVAGGRDVDGDGLPDIVVGSPRTADAEGFWDGAAHVVFGKADAAPVTLGSQGSVALAGAGGQSGWSVALAPSSTGADTADVLVGAPFKRQGRVYHVLGGAIGEGLALDRLGGRGFRYAGTVDLGRFGNSIAPLDGNVLIGEPEGLNDDGVVVPGAAYLMRPATEDLSHPPPRIEFTTYGAYQEAQLGSYCWDGICTDREPGFPRKEKVGRGDPALLHIDSPAMPDDLSLVEYRELDASGAPTGQATPLQAELVDKRRKVVARFELPAHRGESYLVASARWEGADRGETRTFLALDLGRPYRVMPSPPKTHLRFRDEQRRGGSYSWQWTNCYVNGMCSSTIADYAARTRPLRPLHAEPGAAASIRIGTRYRPDVWRLSMHRRLDDLFFPAGRGRTVTAALRPFMENGERVAWDVRFELPATGERVFFVMHARWQGHGVIDHDFHVRLD